MKIPATFLTAIEKAINRYLALDPVAVERLSSYHDKIVAVEISGLDFTFYILIKDKGVIVSQQEPDNIDTWLTGAPASLIKMGLSNKAVDTENIMFSGEVEIRGDVELGQALKTVFNEIDIDLEEQLSKITGDVVAHQVGNLVRGGAQWGRKSLQTLELDLAEYLQEEINFLPRREEVNSFLSGVDQLRSDVDRMEARVKSLYSAAHPSGVDG